MIHGDDHKKFSSTGTNKSEGYMHSWNFLSGIYVVLPISKNKRNVFILNFNFWLKKAISIADTKMNGCHFS